MTGVCGGGRLRGEGDGDGVPEVELGGRFRFGGSAVCSNLLLRPWGNLVLRWCIHLASSCRSSVRGGCARIVMRASV